jgi:hypothetical protein
MRATGGYNSLTREKTKTLNTRSAAQDAEAGSRGPKTESAGPMWRWEALVYVVCWAVLNAAPTQSQDSCGTATPSAMCTPKGLYSSSNHSAGGANVPRVLYAEHFGGPEDDWGDRINAAIQASFAAAPPAVIMLPMGVLNISKPLKLWRQRKSHDVDTTAANVSAFADLGAVWESIKGGEPSDLARGFHLRGVPGGGYASSALSTRLRWTGANDSVMLDMPAPWHCHISDLMLDGAGTEGLVGIRYRAGYEFGVNGGKVNTFERLSIFSLHVAIEVGGPMIPDLVSSSFRNLEIHDINVGLRFFGGNVAEMWVSELMIASFVSAGIELRGYAIRTARPRSAADTPPTRPPLQDADGREIFVEQLPAWALAHDGAVLACPPCVLCPCASLC